MYAFGIFCLDVLLLSRWATCLPTVPESSEGIENITYTDLASSFNASVALGQNSTQSLDAIPEGLILSIHWLSNAVSLITYYALMITLAQQASEEDYTERIRGSFDLYESPYQTSFAPKDDATTRKLEFRDIVNGIFIVSNQMYQRRMYQEFIADIFVHKEKIGELAFRVNSAPAIGLGTGNLSAPVLDPTVGGPGQNNTFTDILKSDNDHVFFNVDGIGTKSRVNAEQLFLLTLTIMANVAVNPSTRPVTETLNFGEDTQVSITVTIEPQNPRTDMKVRYKDITFALAKVALDCTTKGFWEKKVTWQDIEKPGGRIELGTMLIEKRWGVGASAQDSDHSIGVF